MAKMQPKQSDAGSRLEQDLERLIAISRADEERAAILALFKEMAGLENQPIQYISRPAYNAG